MRGGNGKHHIGCHSQELSCLVFQTLWIAAS
jgi:hypothetical protein